MTNEELITQIREGTAAPNAMEILYMKNTGIMYDAARKFAGHTELEDLMQEAYIGLHNAVYGYTPEKGAFITYAYHHIYGAMSRYAKGQGSITMSEHMKVLITKYNRIISDSKKNNENTPSLQHIAYLLGVSEETAKLVAESAHKVNVTSIDVAVSDDGNETIADTLKGSDGIEDDVVNRMEFKQVSEELWQQVEELEENQAHIILKRYKNDATLQEIGEDMGASPGKVRTIQNKALKKLRERIKNTCIMDYVNEYIYSHAIRSSSFNRTWTSSTEYVALKLYDGEMW